MALRYRHTEVIEQLRAENAALRLDLKQEEKLSSTLAYERNELKDKLAVAERDSVRLVHLWRNRHDEEFVKSIEARDDDESFREAIDATIAAKPKE